MTIDSTQTFQLRISILYFLQCYLFKNNHGKSMIIQTFLSKIDTSKDFLFKREVKKEKKKEIVLI